MNLSNRLESMQFSTIRKLAPFAEDAKKRGVSVYHLNIGQPDIHTPSTFMEGINNFTDKVLKYENSQGMDPLIESFIKYYLEWNIKLSKSEILVTNGGSEAILFAFMAICDPGDEIIIPEPFYTNYNGLADLASVKVIPFITKAEDGFHLPSKDEITSKITKKTRAIMVSNPGNPTGVVYTQAEIRMLADIVKENDIFLISDEVYREFVYDDLKYTSALYMKDIEDKIILIDSISKRYSACGARIGLVASKHKHLMAQMIKLGQSRLCVPVIEQVAAANLINTPKSYFTEVKKEYEERRNILYKYLLKIPGVVCEKPTGAFYIVAKLPVKSAEDFAKWLLTDFNYNNKTVMVAPAQGFYATKGLGINEIRLSYCLNTTALKDAMEILGIAIKKYVELNN
ncbi:pyridoxal phosphate-dependent aminotransferase [Clostridium estertheticum]|uniref:Aminotransferase n=1 Tax=Clostridium estertheticum subsp. estertheticum TaxID=1552 RepID=A0A1J0GHQ3_9CLOT|nr:pyridoxal phosphate-dependent aminotransferase [Clostridium estertheticum]APC40889.1 aspartate aminotransferase [Clostridium estertheticum subsp. estertheticum]MBU3073944.1 pyridoxal phosphate-dependent aminotransferase [Clostridium estertheticum]MBU3164038.1 pyridoxal phosphate-dependent aminotransferase [Clostridium estertheticum]MBU3187143.1 pyridoxal phosphate-dependent aminotransferase [Clostridium estertheticum]MBZ9617249.1 pyridoxal phosphate-dependent aminotransferase [Clostridium e